MPSSFRSIALSCLFLLTCALPAHAQVQSLTTNGPENVRKFNVPSHTSPGSSAGRNLNNDNGYDDPKYTPGPQHTQQKGSNQNVYNRNDDEQSDGTRPAHKNRPPRSIWRRNNAPQEGGGYN